MQQVRHRANVYAATEVSLVGQGQPFNRASVASALDLGNITEQRIAGPVQAGLNMRIRTNTGYAVTLQSQYSGMLRLGDTIEGAIPYTLTVNGQATPLSGGAVAALPPASTLTGPDGVNLPISIMLTPAAGQQRPPAGVYRDVITISVRPY
jgi:spore coat protein U-like protein